MTFESIPLDPEWDRIRGLCIRIEALYQQIQSPHDAAIHDILKLLIDEVAFLKSKIELMSRYM